MKEWIWICQGMLGIYYHLKKNLWIYIDLLCGMLNIMRKTDLLMRQFKLHWGVNLNVVFAWLT